MGLAWFVFTQRRRAATRLGRVRFMKEDTKRYLVQLRALNHRRATLQAIVDGCNQANRIPPDLYTQMMALVDEIKKSSERLRFEREMQYRGLKIH